MKICGISDLHGKCPDLIVEPCDVLFICGDVIPLRMQRNVPQSFSWFKKEFIPWCNKQPVDKIYMVGGNHDFFLVNEAEAKEHLINTNVTLLYNESAEYMDNNGKVWANSGQIGPWSLNKTRLSNGTVGLGTLNFNYNPSGTHYNPTAISIHILWIILFYQIFLGR